MDREDDEGVTEAFFSGVFDKSISRVVIHGGTWMPGSIILAWGIALLLAIAWDLTWQRSTVYFVTGVSLVFGLEALIKMAMAPLQGWPTMLLLSFIYQKANLAVMYWTLVMASLQAIYPGYLHIIPDRAIWTLLVGASTSMISVNLLLFFGRKRGWLMGVTDPVPLRSVIRALRERQSRHGE